MVETFTNFCRFLRFNAAVLCLFSLSLVFGPDLCGQVYTGTLRGTVTDTSGAVIPGVTMTLTNEGTAITVTMKTERNGAYIFPLVKVGAYSVKATANGFESVVRVHVAVHIQQQVVVNFLMHPGAVTQTVQVTAAPPLLQVESASVGQDVGTQEINNLPLNGRNFTFLAQLSPGVTTIESSEGRGLEGNGMFAANGTRGSEQNYMLNGVDDNNTEPDYSSGTAYAILPPVDALEEFKMETNNYSAELGRAAGAVLNATLKSGTNQIHGDAWDFLRNDALDGADFFEDASNEKKSEFIRNQFGFTLGGPVTIPKIYSGKDRTFFFVDYEGERILEGTTFLTTVPTALERGSGFTDFSDALEGQPGITPPDLLGRQFPVGQIFDPATTRAVVQGQVDPVTGLVAASSGYVRDPFPGNILPANRLDPNAIKLLDLYPLPNLLGVIDNYAGSPVATTNSNTVDARVDENLSNRDRIFAEFDNSHLFSITPPPLPGIANGGNTFNTPRNLVATMATLSETHTFSPTMINEAEVGFTRENNSYTQQDSTVYGIPQRFGIQGVPQTNNNGGLPYIDGGGLDNLGVSGVLPTYKDGEVWNIRENITKVQGPHVLKAGFETQYNFIPYLIPPSSRGSFTFSGLYTSVPGENVATVGPGTAQLLLSPIAATVPNGIDNVGGADSISASNAVQTVAIRHYYAGYIQDNWQATRRLALDIGVRYDYFSPILNRYDALTNFDPGPGFDGAQWLFPLSREGNPPVSAAFIQTMQEDGIDVKYVSNPYGISRTDNFAPRLGFAYHLRHNLAVRGGYGIFYNDFEDSSGGDHYGSDNYPFLFSYSFTAPDPDHPITPDNSIGSLENGLLNIPLTPANVTGEGLGPIGRQYNFKTPYVQGANFTIQYQLGRNQSVQLGYVGTFSRHLPVTQPANDVSEILPPLVSYLQHIPYADLSPGFNYITYQGNTGYNSLQASFERRFSQGLTFLGDYTYSKCRGDAQDQLLETYGFRAPDIPGFGIQGDYALCEYDERNVGHFSGIYQLPFGNGGKFLRDSGKLTNALVGGWTTNWILTLTDGMPFSVPCTITTASGAGCNALFVPGENPIGGEHNVNQWMNPKAFMDPSVATSIGQASFAPLGSIPGQVIGPGFHRLDFSLFRRFKTSERTALEFRAEVFNLTNTPNFAQPSNTNFASPAFGRITATVDDPNDPREIQFALKFYW
jgi:Carboxypeptidase regulatory-like domain/TonB dependent receptor